MIEHDNALNLDTGDARSSMEAMHAANLDWTVNQEPIFLRDGRRVPSQFAVVRSDTRKVLGVVSNSFEPLQNSNAFAWFDPFVSAGEARYATAGAFREGKIVWILAKLERDPSIITPNDVINKYILLSNRHDGHGAISCGFTPIRVVCQNTLHMALTSEASSLLRVRHTKQAIADLSRIRETMNTINASFEANAEHYRRFAAVRIDDQALAAYFRRVFDISNAPTKRQENLLTRLHELHEDGPGADTSRGTLWGAYNAVTDYLSHERGRDESRLHSLWLGDGADIGQLAFQRAQQLVSAAA